MKRIGLIVVLVLLAAAAVVIYPSAHASYVRYRAGGHLQQAEALRTQLSSPVARDSLAGASARVRFALMRSESAPDEIAAADRALVQVMTIVTSAPPPDHPVSGVATYDRVARPGRNFAVNVSIRTSVKEAYLVAVTAEFGVDNGWKSGTVRRDFNQPITAPIDAHFDFMIPSDAAGQGRVRTAVIYRLNPTGEGEDLLERPNDPKPIVTIQKTPD